MSSDYGYINARLRGMHSRLLTERLEEAVGADSYDEFLRLLAESDFGPEIGEATAQNAGLKELDHAVSRNFSMTAQRVLGLSDGQPGQDIGLFLTRYDLLNLKTIVRGKLTNREPAEIEINLLPAGPLKLALLGQLLAAVDLSAMASLLGGFAHPLAGAFRKAVTQFSSDNDLLAFEVSLDRSYYAAAIKGTKNETLRRFFSREIDGINLLTALKVRGLSDVERYFVPGGLEVSLERFRQIASDGGFEGFNFFAELSGITTLGQAETIVRQKILSEAHRLYAADSLGIGVAIGYLKAKENEVALTRLLARGKFYRVPAETLRQEVKNA